MTMVGKTLVGLTAALLCATGPAFASTDSEVENELAEMRELVEGLKQKVEAQEEQIEHQGAMLEDAQRVVRDVQSDSDSASGLSEFWEAIDVNMSVAGSYAFNFRNPDLAAGAAAGPPRVSGTPGIGANNGALGLYPFHPDHNSFQIDQVWIDIGKASTEESRAGFHFTLLYGNTAAFLGQGGNRTAGGGTFAVVGGGGGTVTVPATPIGRRNAGFDSTSEYYVHQAYVSYLAPLGEGVEVKMGKFGTLLGAEVADTTANNHITLANLYQLFQPIDHIGVLASTSFGPVGFQAGVVNEAQLGSSSPDINKEKAYLGQISFAASDELSTALTILYGRDGPGAAGAAGNTLGQNDRANGTLDFLVNYDSDAFSAYVNSDLVWIEGTGLAGWGIAVSGLVPITDVFSVAARLEYARDYDNLLGFGPAIPVVGGAPFFNPGRNSHVYSAVGTLAYELAENLTVRGEVRWDRVNEDTSLTGAGLPVEAFASNTAGGREDQVVGLAQVMYSF